MVTLLFGAAFGIST